MKPQHVLTNLEEAIDLFLHELPDPIVSLVSTVVDMFEIEGNEVKMKAQKAKGCLGYIWKIDYQN